MAEPYNLGRGSAGFDFEKAFGRPTKVVNDALMQAFGSYEGGKMLFLGLGTCLGSATVGGETQARLFNVVKPGGIVVSAVSQPDQQLAHQRGVRALFFLVEITTARLNRLAKKCSTRVNCARQSPPS